MRSYGLVAKKRGSNRELRFIHKLEWAPTPEEMLMRVRGKYLGDPEFRRKWAGWDFMPVVIDLCFEVTPTGGGIFHKNEREEVIVR